MDRKYNIEITPRAAQIIWAALLELPGKIAFDTMMEIKPQLESQETPLPTITPPTPAEIGDRNG